MCIRVDQKHAILVSYKTHFHFLRCWLWVTALYGQTLAMSANATADELHERNSRDRSFSSHRIPHDRGIGDGF